MNDSTKIQMIKPTLSFLKIRVITFILCFAALCFFGEKSAFAGWPGECTLVAHSPVYTINHDYCVETLDVSMETGKITDGPYVEHGEKEPCVSFAVKTLYYGGREEGWWTGDFILNRSYYAGVGIPGIEAPVGSHGELQWWRPEEGCPAHGPNIPLNFGPPSDICRVP